MPYIGYAPARKPLTSADITDSVVTSAKIVDGTIALADLSATGTASSSTYLRGDNSWGAVSSDYVLLATATASSSATVSFDGYFSSTYTNYKLVINGLLPATNAVNFFGRFRRSNADVTASNYWGAGMYGYSYSTVPSGDWYQGQNGAQLQLTGRGSFANTSGKTTNWNIDIYEPLNTSNYKNIYFTQTGYWETANNLYAAWWGGGVLYDSTAALSGITFYFSSGNISTGTFKLYGIK